MPCGGVIQFAGNSEVECQGNWIIPFSFKSANRQIGCLIQGKDMIIYLFQRTKTEIFYDE
jgi:hypothetical protein